MKFPLVWRSQLEAFQENSKRYETLLESELKYYREKFEAEKNRADRAVDAIAERNGVEPLSNVVRQERISDHTAAKSMAEQMQELFADVTASVLGQDVNNESGETGDPVIENTASSPN